jgi:hypothetical protein
MNLGGELCQSESPTGRTVATHRNVQTPPRSAPLPHLALLQPDRNLCPQCHTISATRRISMHSTVSCPNHDTAHSSTYNRITPVHRGAPANAANRTPNYAACTANAQTPARRSGTTRLPADAQQRARMCVTRSKPAIKRRNTTSLPARRAQNTTRQRACRFGHQIGTRAIIVSKYL